MKKLKKQLKPSKQFLQNSKNLEQAPTEALTTESNSSESIDFKKVVEQSKANIGGAEIKRARGRPKKSGAPSPQPSSETIQNSSESQTSIPETSGFPPGTFKRVWEFGANTLAARYQDEAFKLSDDESSMLDSATEPVAAKYFPAQGLESRPVLALVFSIAVVFGPKVFTHVTKRRDAEKSEIASESKEAPQKPLDITKPFPVETR